MYLELLQLSFKVPLVDDVLGLLSICFLLYTLAFSVDWRVIQQISTSRSLKAFVQASDSFRDSDSAPASCLIYQNAPRCFAPKW